MLRPFVQSLPEVLHFQENIITLLVEQVTTCDSVVLPVYTKLVTALARYIELKCINIHNHAYTNKSCHENL